MDKYELVLRETNCPVRRFKVSPAGLTIGRGASNTISLASNLASRLHARVWLDDKTLRIEDLDSRNGITVNGELTKMSALQPGDCLVIGESNFTVAKAADTGLIHTAIKLDDASALSQTMTGDARDERLPILYRSAQLLGSVFDLEELLSQILSLIFEALPVRRGYVLTLGSDSIHPEIRATHYHEDEAAEQDAPLSHTLIKHVLEYRESILTVNAQDDSRFDQASSIVNYNIRAAMCAPLCGRENVVGLIYVDSGALSRTFNKEDLELLTAIAGVVGVAVENARLYQDYMQKERLAAIGEATAGLGHCIKNILTGIRGGGQMISMAMERKDFEFLGKGWTILSRAIERIDMMVLNMLTFSRETTLERRFIDLNGIVREIFGIVQTRADRLKISLELIDENDAPANVDPREFYRAVLNLIVNALDAMEIEGGTLQVRTTMDKDGSHLLEFTDSGVGLPNSSPDSLRHS
jgi:K+-sensing histidine kinase KdpD